MIGYREHDGGRRDAGFKGGAGDCVTRAIAIATGEKYRAVYRELRELSHSMTGGLKRSVRNGVSTPVSHKYLMDRGWDLLLTDGSYFTADAIPMEGTVICQLHRHLVAVIDGVAYDTWDSRKDNRTKCGAPRLLGVYR